MSPDIPPVIPAQPAVQKSSQKWFWLAIVLLAAAVVGVWYWQQRKINNSSSKAATQTSTTPPPKAETVPSTTTYLAKVGKFKLSVPSKYAIIVGHDGGFDGGPSTNLTIGDTTSSGNVVDINDSDSTTIFSTQNAPWAKTFQAEVDSELKSAPPHKLLPSIMIDGVSAEVYSFSGKGDTKAVFFTKSGLYYRINLTDDSANNQKLDAIVSGWKFQ